MVSRHHTMWRYALLCCRVPAGMMLPWLQLQICASSFVEQLAAGWHCCCGEAHLHHGRCQGQFQALPI